MILKNIENCFNRALLHSFSKKKFFLVFIVLILCGILVVFCRALGYKSNNWISMSLIFIPIFLSSGILLALGTLLIRIYYHEVKSLKLFYKEIFLQSWDLIIGTTYLSIPPILIYLLLWMILGIFILLKQLPAIGDFVGVILAFAPFLIILSSIFLVFINLAILFYVTPAIALGSKEKFTIAKTVFLRLKKNVFGNLFFFFIGILPIGLIVGFLSLAAYLTGINYLESENILSFSIRSFFIMLPFCFFLTTAIIFFFNFAAESYNMLIKRID